MDQVITLVALLFIGVLTVSAYKIAMSHWKECKANEWCVVLRNGEMVKCGIGLNTWVMPGD